jgi:GAF domain-containing protein
MRKRIGIFGVTEEVLRLLHLLDANPEVQLLRCWDEDRAAALERAHRVGPEIAAQITPLLCDDVEEFGGHGDLDAVIDTGGEARFTRLFPRAVDRGVQVVSPLTARLLWGYGIASRDRKSELLQALREVVESVDLAIDSDELFLRMLDIAVGVTGADGGSLMLLDPSARNLVIRVAIGVEPELWPKIRVPVGEGIAGRVAADARPLRLRGKADAQAFHLVRERLDVESALCVPLVHSGRVLGVLNLHHCTHPDAFSEQDLSFMEQIARLDAQIISRAQEHQALRDQAARYKAVRDVQALLATTAPLLERLQALCRFVAEHVGHGIATVYLYDGDDKDLRLAATSLEGGGFGGEYRVIKGQGVDGRVAETGQSIFLRDDNGAVAYVCLPLHAGERLVGVLAIQSGDDAPRGRAAEEILLEMAAALAEGIAQADREARMAARATRASALNEAGIRMISAKDLAEVARLATSSAAMILEAEHAVLRLQDDQTRRYVIRSYFGPADGRQQERLFRLDKEVSVDTIKRRSAALLRDLREDPTVGTLAEDFRSGMAAPLKRDGQVIGTLVVYDKVAPDHFYAELFSDDDFQSFARFVSYVERAVANSLFRAHARQNRNFDEDTGLPNTSYISKRIHEEIARSQGREGALALAVCRIENLDEVTSAANPIHAKRVVQQTADALRSHLRDFDVLGRTGDGEFTVLMPEPGPAPGERVFELARSVADAISKDEALNAPQRIALAFGYAVHPGDGPERDSLLDRARTPRIRMV